jgi:radical SAM protein with 4Fe4S-binding SPASM domain
MPDNLSDRVNLAQYIRTLGVSGFTAVYPMPSYNDTYDEYCAKRVPFSSFRVIEEQLRALADNDFFVRFQKDEINVFPSADYCNSESESEFNEAIAILSACSAGNKALEIAPNGDVYPCCITAGEHEYMIGNCFTHSFSSIWQHPILSHFREHKPSTTIFNSALCGGCNENWLCNTQCPVITKLFPIPRYSHSCVIQN